MVPVKFIVDGMHGSLARKLRIYGFDTKYDIGIEDELLVVMAMQEERILLTSDKNLFQRFVRKELDSILVNGSTDKERLASMFKSLNLKPSRIVLNKTRCPVCNGKIRKARDGEVSGKVPERVFTYHKAFFICSDCLKIYWEGGHWRRLHEFSMKVGKRFLEESKKD